MNVVMTRLRSRRRHQLRREDRRGHAGRDQSRPQGDRSLSGSRGMTELLEVTDLAVSYGVGAGGRWRLAGDRAGRAARHPGRQRCGQDDDHQDAVRSAASACRRDPLRWRDRSPAPEAAPDSPAGHGLGARGPAAVEHADGHGQPAAGRLRPSTTRPSSSGASSEMFERFPRLRERQDQIAGSLSGGRAANGCDRARARSRRRSCC